MIKSGITLIEVSISIFLGSMLVSVLFVSFSQLQQSSQVTESLMEVDMRSQVIMHQMYQDISGAFVPQASLMQTSTIEKEAPQGTGKEKTSQQPDLGTVFMVKHKNNNLDMLICITNNPVAVYDTVKPRIARVVYRLITDKKDEGTFRLVRQESADLDLKAFSKEGVNAPRSFQLAHNIKSCSCSCTLLEYPQLKSDQKQQDKQKQPEQKSDTPPTVRTLTDWIFDPKKAKEEKMPSLPYAITLKCIFWDDRHRREWPVEFSIPIAAFEPYGQKKGATLKNQEPEKKPEFDKDAVQKNNKVVQQQNIPKKTDNSSITVQVAIPENLKKFMTKQNELLQ